MTNRGHHFESNTSQLIQLEGGVTSTNREGTITFRLRMPSFFSLYIYNKFGCCPAEFLYRTNGKLPFPEFVVESVCISGFPQFMNKIAGDSNLNINTSESQSLTTRQNSNIVITHHQHDIFGDHQTSPSHDKPFVPLTLPTCSCTSNRSAYGIKAWNIIENNSSDPKNLLGGTHREGPMFFWENSNKQHNPTEHTPRCPQPPLYENVCLFFWGRGGGEGIKQKWPPLPTEKSTAQHLCGLGGHHT